MMEARYVGECWRCYGVIHVGDDITMVGEHWEHVNCPTLLTPPKRQTCAVCFQELSVSGACGCD